MKREDGKFRGIWQICFSIRATPNNPESTCALRYSSLTDKPNFITILDLGGNEDDDPRSIFHTCKVVDPLTIDLMLNYAGRSTIGMINCIKMTELK
jgi:hypothetical protein